MISKFCNLEDYSRFKKFLKTISKINQIHFANFEKLFQIIYGAQNLVQIFAAKQK